MEGNVNGPDVLLYMVCAWRVASGMCLFVSAMCTEPDRVVQFGTVSECFLFL